jgi:hypothetical protein
VLNSDIPRFTSGALLYHPRNRWLHPTLGRWTSRDPNGLGQPVQQSWAMHGATADVSLSHPDIRASWTDGANLQQYVRGNPQMGGDEMGLFISLPGMMSTAMNMADMAADTLDQAYQGVGIGLMFASMLDAYVEAMDYDVDWALDWNQPDWLYSQSGSDGRNYGDYRIDWADDEEWLAEEDMNEPAMAGVIRIPTEFQAHTAHVGVARLVGIGDNACGKEAACGSASVNRATWRGWRS